MSIDFDALTAFLQTLVRIPSLSGEEEPIMEPIAMEMRRLGYDRVFTDRNGSLIGIVQGAEPGPTLLLDAHCDTVGIAPGIPWEHDPFGAEQAGDRLYGRGAADMKGALAAMVHAVGAADRARLAGRVAVSASVMEEVMEGVALRTVVEAVQPDYVVIGEATDLNLNHGGRGRAEIRVETIGRPAHSSTPELGVNAVHRMVEAVQAIEVMSLPADPLLGPALMVLTDIISDPYPGHSVIPSRCRATYDRRLLVGETPDSVLEALRALPVPDLRVDLVEGEHRTYTGAVLRQPKFFPAWKLDVAHPFVQSARAGLRGVGLDPQWGAYRFCTNGAYSAGEAHIPTLGFGPSTEGHAHIVDEYIDLPQLHRAAQGYRGIVEAVLGRGDRG